MAKYFIFFQNLHGHATGGNFFIHTTKLCVKNNFLCCSKSDLENKFLKYTKSEKCNVWIGDLGEKMAIKKKNARAT